MGAKLHLIGFYARDKDSFHCLPEDASRFAVHNKDVTHRHQSEPHAASADVWCFSSHMEMRAARADGTFPGRVPLAHCSAAARACTWHTSPFVLVLKDLK